MIPSLMLTVAAADDGERLDKWLARATPDLSRARLQALIRAGHVSLADGSLMDEPKYGVRAGQVFYVHVPEPEEAVPRPQAISLDIVYEDTDLIVVNKPPGLVVHPAPGNPEGTLVNALLHHCKGSLSGIGGVKRPGIVHRIDKDTSGLLVMAKTDKAHQGLAVQFAEHSITRRYDAIVRGRPQPLQGRVETQIGRNPHDRKKMAVVTAGGKRAITHYACAKSVHDKSGRALASLVRCMLETGRTHQVRVHMTHVGCPLLGDPVYGGGKVPHGPLRDALSSFKRQALHATHLGFVHPLNGEAMAFDRPMPADMAQLLSRLHQLEGQ